MIVETTIAADADVLDSAADLIETYGWVQMHQGNRRVGFCLVGSIDEALGERGYEQGCWIPEFHANVHAVEDHLGIVANDSVVELVREAAWWNDQPKRTQYEVIDALRHTAKELRK